MYITLTCLSIAWCAAHILDTSTLLTGLSLRPMVKLTPLIFKNLLYLSNLLTIIEFRSTLNGINNTAESVDDCTWIGILN